MSVAVERILDKLEGVKRTGDRWVARCPAHEDLNPSLSIKEGDDGRVLVHCHADCETADVLARISLTERDLFNSPPPQRPPNATGRREVAVYPYRDKGGALVYEVVRYEPKTFKQRAVRPDGSRVWSMDGVARVPYRLPEVLAADPSATIYICEGEKDADALAARGLVATTNAGGAANWPERFSEYLAGRRVTILPDNDTPGEGHMQQVATALYPQVAGLCVALFPDLPDKGDVSDWLVAGGDVADLPAFARVVKPYNREIATRRGGGLNAVTLRAEAERAPVALIRKARDLECAPLDWVVDELLPADSLVLLHGEDGTFKSFLTLAWCCTVVTGTPWQGRDTARGGALYLTAEGQSGFGRRRRAWEIVNRQDAGDLDVVTVAFRLPNADDLAPLLADVAALDHKPRLIVIDTLNRYFEGDENATADMTRFIAACDHLRRLTGACVVVVHHDNRNGEYRGNSALVRAMDARYRVDRDGDAVTVTCAKMKDEEQLPAIRLESKRVELGGRDRKGRELTSLVLVQTGPRLGAREHAGLDAITEAGADGLAPSDFVKALERAGYAGDNHARRARAELERLGLLRVRGENRARRYHATGATGGPSTVDAADEEDWRSKPPF